MRDFLVIEDILYLHANQLDLYGGDHGLRDINLLDSAVAQPQATFGGNPLHTFPFKMACGSHFCRGMSH